MNISGFFDAWFSKLKNSDVWIGSIVSSIASGLLAGIIVSIGIISYIILSVLSVVLPSYLTVPLAILALLAMIVILIPVSLIPTITLFEIMDKKANWKDALFSFPRYVWNMSLAIIGRGIASFLILTVIPGILVVIGIIIGAVFGSKGIAGLTILLAILALFVMLFVTILFNLLVFTTEAVSFKEGLGLTAFMRALGIAKQDLIRYLVMVFLAIIILEFINILVLIFTLGILSAIVMMPLLAALELTLYDELTKR